MNSSPSSSYTWIGKTKWFLNTPTLATDSGLYYIWVRLALGPWELSAILIWEVYEGSYCTGSVKMRNELKHLRKEEEDYKRSWVENYWFNSQKNLYTLHDALGPNLLNHYSLLTFLDEEGDIVMGFLYEPMGNGVWPKASTATHKP